MKIFIIFIHSLKCDNMSENPNNYKNQKLRGLKRKYEAVLLKGGKCEKCGYNKNIAALEFHHKNPEEKEFGLDERNFSNRSLESLKKELDKCMLLCANCHREIHHFGSEMSLISTKILNIEKLSFSNKESLGSICPTCGKRFLKVTGKIYCSKKCREKAKDYPSIEEVNQKYKKLKSWEKVAQSFGLTRKIIQGIRKNS